MPVFQEEKDQITMVKTKTLPAGCLGTMTLSSCVWTPEEGELDLG